MAAIKNNQITVVFIIVSLFIHLLIFFFYLNQIIPSSVKPKFNEEQQPNFISSYSYIEKGTQYESSNVKAKANSVDNKTNHENINKKTKWEKSDNKPIVIKNKSVILKPTQSLTAASLDYIKNQQIKAMVHQEAEEPIYLIGDTNQPPSLLIKLVARALSKHFYYPEQAGKFGIRGKALVSFVLDPSGHIYNINLIKSSTVTELDAAALYATNSAPRVIGADRFITKPKSFVVGFVFR